MTPEERAEKLIREECAPLAGESFLFPVTLHSRIADAIREAVLEEREACAKVAESAVGPSGATLPDGDDGVAQDGHNRAAEWIAEAVRARGS